MSKTTIDFRHDRVLYGGNTVYWWKDRKIDSTSSEEETIVRDWYRYSTKHGYETDIEYKIFDRKKRTIVELKRMEAEAAEPIYWVAAAHRVKTPETLKLLNKSVDGAQKERQEKRGIQEQQRRSEKKKASHAGSDRRDDGPQPLDPRAKRSDDAGGVEKKGAKKRSSVSFALKSEVSDYVLNLRAAPSKKQKGLHNVSIHLGSRFLGYAEVRPEVLGDLGQRLVDLSKRATHVAD